MIISANRLSSVNGRVSIGINENYGSEDLGRIMLEDAKNDMAIFNAALMQDMHEIKARQEGTLLESEIQAISEGAIKDFCKKIVEKLKAFWAKMKAWFKTAIANISAYIVRDGQAFVKMHLKDIGTLKPDDECGDRWVLKGDLKFEVPKNINDYNKLEIDSSATDFKNWVLKSICKEYSDGDNFYDAMKKERFDEVKGATVAKMGGTTRMTETLRNGKTNISGIKTLEKQEEKVIRDLIRESEKVAKDNLSAEEKKENKDADKVNELNKKVTMLSNAASGVTAGLATAGKVYIKLVKFDMAQCRKALATAIGRSARAKTEATLLESLLLEADEEIEQLSDNEYASDLTPAEEKAVEDLVDAIEEKIEDAESGDDD